MGQSKLELILELKNRLFNKKLMDSKDKFNKAKDGMGSKLQKFKTMHIGAFSQMTAQYPMMARGLELITSKVALFAAGAALIGGVMLSGIKHAKEFNHEFLPIANLNLDKSKGQLETYKNTIRDTAFDTGANLNATARAFYDVQSATGLFGDKAASVVKQVSKFSIATGADLNESINATTKAMKAFGLGVGDIEKMLESNAKTVQVGITTFEELARVQTEYAGAAAGTGQSLDTANKVFAAFTSIAKDSSVAANMTKTAFQGLTQQGTIDGLKKIGVSVYDNKGQMRDLSVVLEEVSGKFQKMSPAKIDALINKIGGPEGLRNLFVKLKTDSSDFFNTLKAFDASQFNLDEALKNAQGDVTVLSEIVKNRWGVLMEKLGQKLLPMVAKALESINNLIVGGIAFYEKNSEVINTMATVVGTVIGALKAWKVAQIAVNVATNANPIMLIITAIGLLVAAIVDVINHWDEYKAKWIFTWVMVKNTTKMSWNMMSLSFRLGVNSFKMAWQQMKHIGELIMGMFSNIGRAIKLTFEGDFEGAAKAMMAPIKTEASKAMEKLKGERSQMLKDNNKDNLKLALEMRQAALATVKKTEKQKSQQKMGQSLGKGSGTSTDEDGTKRNSSGSFGGADTGIEKVTGAAANVKNITVNIDAFNKGGINTANTTMAKMDAKELEAWFSEMLLRAIRNLELAQ